jgi:hypothetical protein
MNELWMLFGAIEFEESIGLLRIDQRFHWVLEVFCCCRTGRHFPEIPPEESAITSMQACKDHRIPPVLLSNHVVTLSHMAIAVEVVAVPVRILFRRPSPLKAG